MPKVSIIMPTHNRALVLGRAIASVLSQEYDDFELIVVNDSSTDGTSSILDAQTDKRLKTFYSDKRKAPAARNLGFEHASGELIAYLDSDNVWHPNFLRVMVSELESTFVMAYSAQNLLLANSCDNNRINVISRKTRAVSYNPLALLRANYIDINSVIHRRDLLNEVGYFDEELTTHEDWDLLARIVIKYPFGVKYVDQVLSDYYFFTPEALPTITNTHFADDVLRIFGFDSTCGSVNAVREKIRQYRKGSKLS